VKDALAKDADKVLVGDTAWRKRYVARSQHPETDGEKMRCEGDRVVELSRRIESERASGEFIGVTKFSADGARELCEAFDRAKATYEGKPFREGRTFEKAYLIDLFQPMVEEGSDFRWVTTDGGYMELDTLEDLSMAEAWWKGEPT
jgi:choline kinase